MNSDAVLALIADLYGQVVALQRENVQLREQLEAQGQAEPEINVKPA